MNLPPALLTSLIGLPGYEAGAFTAVHEAGAQFTSIRLNPAKVNNEAAALFPGINTTPIPWAEKGYYLSERPSFTFDPLFHAGCYYVQEASSMLPELAIRQHTDSATPLRVLDLCAAPGGKSTHLQSILPQDSLLVSNEVIRSRAGILKDNMIKWGSANVVVTNNDPADFSRLPHYFDIILADAPCSGSGLFRRDPDAISEWSENNVQLCSQRQQRILADAWPALKPGGLLIYSTCSFSQPEDEAIVQWMIKELKAEYLPLQLPASSGITDTGHGYRCWPHLVAGEGFFIACLRKTAGEENDVIYKWKEKPATLNKQQAAVVSAWINEGDHFLLPHENTIYIWPVNRVAELAALRQQLRFVYSGVMAGELVRDKLIPAHALAMSTLLSKEVKQYSLSKETAIQYLQRKEFLPDDMTTGWQTVSYNGHPLGWVNKLPNRINNYYPKELRILKERE